GAHRGRSADTRERPRPARRAPRRRRSARPTPATWGAPTWPPTPPRRSERPGEAEPLLDRPLSGTRGRTRARPRPARRAPRARRSVRPTPATWGGPAQPPPPPPPPRRPRAAPPRPPPP